MQLRAASISVFALGIFLTGCATKAENKIETESSSNSWPCYILTAEKVWQLNPSQGERFDASGLLLRKNGDLLTVNDRDPTLRRIQFFENKNSADLVVLPDFFNATELAPFASEKAGRYDCEGIAEDKQGRIYLCEEANRWILRLDPKTKKVERLPIDWSPVEKYFHPTDHNASFEGIAIGDGKLFVANERQEGRIIVVDLKSLKIVDDFTVRPTKTKMKDIHYSDLCWFDGALFALLRENRVVVKINAKEHRILAEYNFGEMTQEPEVAYLAPNTLEGLAVDKNYFWLVTDNNGLPRKRFLLDPRPTLFKCPRPDK